LDIIVAFEKSARFLAIWNAVLDSMIYIPEDASIPNLVHETKEIEDIKIHSSTK